MLFGRNNVGEYHNFDLPKSQKFPSVFAWGPSRLILSGTIKAWDHQDFQFLLQSYTSSSPSILDSALFLFEISLIQFYSNLLFQLKFLELVLCLCYFSIEFLPV